MLTAEPDAPPAPCGTCRNPIVHTILGWMHIDANGVPVTWMCPPPAMTLAHPRPAPTRKPRHVTEIPASHRRGRAADNQEVTLVLGAAQPTTRPTPTTEV